MMFGRAEASRLESGAAGSTAPADAPLRPVTRTSTTLAQTSAGATIAFFAVFTGSLSHVHSCPKIRRTGRIPPASLRRGGNGRPYRIRFTTSGRALSGIYDANNLGWLISDASLGPNGLNSAGSSGIGTVQFPELQITGNSYIGALDFIYYVVNDSSAILLETDSAQTGTGVLLLQGASPSPGVTFFHTLRVKPASFH